MSMENDTQTDATLAALRLVVSELRQHSGLKPNDFPVAFERVVQGSDGTSWQDTYCRELSALIGHE